MATLNKCMFIGNVGQDPTIRQFENGSVANLSLAVSERYTDRSGQSVERTEWISLVANGKLVDVIGQYVTKGTTLYVETRMRTRKYTDQSGQERSVTEFIVLSMQLLSKPSQSQSQPQNQPTTGYSRPQAQPQPVQQPMGQPQTPVAQQRPSYQPRQRPAPQPMPQQQYETLDPQDDDLPF